MTALRRCCGDIHELLHRNLQEVFGEGDAARLRAATQELYTDDCVLICRLEFSSGICSAGIA